MCCNELILYFEMIIIIYIGLYELYELHELIRGG